MPVAVSAFELPDNAPDRGIPAVGPSASRCIDLVHLARQTMGDKDLEIEVLSLFARQARAALVDMTGGIVPVTTVAHRIKGAAGAVGAFKVASVAAEVESGQTDAATLARFGAAVVEAENFINKLCR
ncbi:Hpt domain-containing protein [Rhizobiales bacterium RZME27]|uniref:Hpt domain-containing protein n=1 Tax=Endobacterium cereale TaxID=2663029 RepID=A0A6A8A9C3_9HYPH|nr:Hpt domain-containing protein [Endobacterium cereale]MEB2843567.1 Hpt domain-containing protein [Endobacterium cereale]MQY47329.1 Hpt domain-containing protein [Endobacterium cereale]